MMIIMIVWEERRAASLVISLTNQNLLLPPLLYMGFSLSFSHCLINEEKNPASWKLWHIISINTCLFGSRFLIRGCGSCSLSLETFSHSPTYSSSLCFLLLGGPSIVPQILSSILGFFHLGREGLTYLISLL